MIDEFYKVLSHGFNPQGEILGATRVKELVAEAGQKSPEQVIAHLKMRGRRGQTGGRRLRP